jgi:hypothetical protein
VQNSQIAFELIAINRNNVLDTLNSNLTFNNFINIDTLFSYEYPNMNLLAKLSIDTINGLGSPIFKSLLFKYTPPCEIIPDNYSFVLSDSTVQEGEDVTVSAKVYNAGFVPAGISVYTWKAVSGTGIHLLR